MINRNEYKEQINSTTVREDSMMICAISSLVTKRISQLRIELKEQYNSLFQDKQSRQVRLDTNTPNVKSEYQTIRKKKINDGMFLKSNFAAEFQTNSDSRTIGSQEDLTLEEVRKFVEYNEFLDTFDQQQQQPRSLIGGQLLEQIEQMEFLQENKKLRERKLKFILPKQDLAQNFRSLMRYSFEEQNEQPRDLETRQNTKHKPSYSYAVSKAITVDKQTIIKQDYQLSNRTMKNQIEENESLNTSYQKMLDDLDRIQNMNSKLSPNRINYVDKIDEILFDPNNMEEIDLSDLNKMIDQSSYQQSHQTSASSYSQFRQVNDELQIPMEDDVLSVHSDHLNHNSNQPKGRTDKKNLQNSISSIKRKSTIDDIFPHHLMTIIETCSQLEQADSKSKINLTQKLNQKKGVDKAQSFYEVLVKVSIDSRYVLNQESPQIFGDIQCHFNNQAIHLQGIQNKGHQ